MPIQLPATPSAALIRGGVSCGKTTELVSCAEGLFSRGVHPRDVLVFAATPTAAQELQRRLGAACSPHQASCTVTTPGQFALRLLSTPAGKQFSGRDGRLIMPFEMDFILEDMKTCGIKPRRLRQMMKFFYRSWKDLADCEGGDEEWLVNDEEVMVHDLLKRNLAVTGGLLEAEVSPLAYQFLLQEPGALLDCRAAHVLVDDYQMLSRASQHLVNLLAKESITIAADPLASVCAFESFPYAAGVEEFVEANAHCDIVELQEGFSCAPALRIANALRERLDPAAGLLLPGNDSAGSFACDEYRSMRAEIDSIAEAIERSVADGASPGDIAVVSFRDSFTRSLAIALRDAGVPCNALFQSRLRHAEFIDPERSAAQRMLALLALVANPCDGVAWRCWCGFGDYLANSVAFAKLRAQMEAEGTSMAKALANASANAGKSPADANELAPLVRAYEEACSIIERVKAYRGSRLLEALADCLGLPLGSKAYRTVVECTCGFAGCPVCEDGAEALMRNARERMSSPVFAEPDTVHIGPASCLVGASPALLMIAGFVDGFFPSREFFGDSVAGTEKQQAIRLNDLRTLYVVMGKAREELRVTGFNEMELYAAELMGLRLGRIRLRAGERVTKISPSIYLDEVVLPSLNQ